MMNLDPVNKNIHKAVIDLLEEKNRFNEEGEFQDDEFGFNYLDYDLCKFNLKRIKDHLLLSFKCFNFDEIYKINGEATLKKYYPEFEITQPQQGYNLTISLNIENQMKQYPEDVTKEQKKEIREENKKRIEQIADNLSKFRRNLYVGPFELALKSLQEDTKHEFRGFQQRQDEWIWIEPASDNQTCSFWFGVNFQDSTDKAIAKIILDEMTEANKIVKGNCPQVKRFEKVPDTLKNNQQFKINLNEFSNGITSISIQREHIKNGFDKQATYLQGFRQYLHYHVHSIKTYIHGRLRKKLGEMQKQNLDAKFIQEDQKQFRTTKEDNQIVDLSQEKIKSADIDKQGN